MNELIKITEKDGKQAVSARELHGFLGSSQQFGNWINNRIKKYGLIENQDYEVFNNLINNPNGGRPLTEYALTLDCAKELAMVEGNEKGKQARQYFIACEKKLKEVSQFQIPQTFSEALRLAAQQAETIDKQQALIESQKPRVLFSTAVETSKSSCLIGELANILGQNGIKIGQNRLFDWLRSNDYLIKQKGERYNDPTQKSMDLELFEIKKRAITNPDETVRVTKTTKVTGKGQVYFVNKFLNKKSA